MMICWSSYGEMVNTMVRMTLQSEEEGEETDEEEWEEVAEDEREEEYAPHPGFHYR